MVSAFKIGEHTSFSDTSAICCTVGYNFTANYQLSYGNRVMSFWNVYDLYFSGGISRVKIKELQTEWISAGKWYDNQYTILDTSNYGYGEIHYGIVAAGVGHDDTKFAKNGGTNLQCIPISYKATVTGARDETEGALKDLLVKLAAKGLITDSTTAS